MQKGSHSFLCYLPWFLQSNDTHLLIFCETCKHSYHIYCLDPPLERMPHKDKFYRFECSDCYCPSDDTCEVMEIDKPTEPDQEMDLSKNVMVTRRRQIHINLKWLSANCCFWNAGIFWIKFYSMQKMRCLKSFINKAIVTIFINRSHISNWVNVGQQFGPSHLPWSTVGLVNCNPGDDGGNPKSCTNGWQAHIAFELLHIRSWIFI